MRAQFLNSLEKRLLVFDMKKISNFLINIRMIL